MRQVWCFGATCLLLATPCAAGEAGAPAIDAGAGLAADQTRLREQVRGADLRQEQQWERQRLRRELRRREAAPRSPGTTDLRPESQMRSLSIRQEREREAETLRRELRADP